MTGAIFGVLNSVIERDDVSRMANRLSHRGRTCTIKPVGDVGWIGVRGSDPDSRISESQGIVLQGTDYETSDLLNKFGEALNRGVKDVQNWNADFAVARVDSETCQITLARDFFGRDPLYWTVLRSGGVAFASEYKALLALPDVNATVDPNMMQHLQHAKRLPIGKTLIEGIQSVHPGSVLTLGRAGNVLAQQDFNPIVVDPKVYDIDDACQLIRNELERAAYARSQDCDPIGLALSGGIDSICLAFLFRKIWPDRRLVTFTAGSHDQDSEVTTARRVAEAVRAEHHEVITPPALLPERLPELVWHLEDPYSRSETLQLYEIGRRAASVGVNVLFSALGADGLFAGMPKDGLLELMRKFPVARLSLQEFYTYTQLGIPPSRILAKIGVWLKFRNTIPSVPCVPNADSPLPLSFPELGSQFINRTLADGFQTSVCQGTQKFERCFGAFAIEHRTPFFDMNFVRAAYTIDDRLKIRNGQQKWIFRRALAPWVPSEFRDIPKFPQRMEANLEFAAVLENMLSTHLPGPLIERHQLFCDQSIKNLRRRDSTKPYSYEGAMRLWTAIMSGIWTRLFIEGRGAMPTSTNSEHA